MKLRECSICSNTKYIGFIHFLTREKYRLCQKHYYEFIRSNMSVDFFIRKKKQEEITSQTKLSS